MTSPMPHSTRPLLDPDQLEQAGRRFRQWLERLGAPQSASSEDDIAWEDGEPRDDTRPPDLIER